MYNPSFNDETSNKYADLFAEKLKLAPLVDNIFDALEKHGQLAITAPSGPVQGVSNPSNGNWKLKPELHKVNDVEIYSPGLFYINDNSDIDTTVKSLTEQ